MKLRTEISAGEEEIVIRCQSRNELIRQIEATLEGMLKSQREIVLHSSGTEYYVPIADILFFESGGGKVYAHTASGLYTAEYKLFELEELLGATFVRISKSSIVNIMQISSLQRELVGNGEISFKQSDRKAYFSRGYYSVLRDKIDEMRLRK